MSTPAPKGKSAASGLFSRIKRLLNRRVFLVIAGVVVLYLIAGAVWRFLFPPLPRAVQAYDIMWTDQGWTTNQREKYYQTTQGCLILPYSWFFALEQEPHFSLGLLRIENRRLFTEIENLTRYRLIPDPRPRYNPDRLPVGITKTVLPDQYVQQLGKGQKEWLSYTCAACHTAQINYKGFAIRIDGAPGMWNFTQFNSTLANSLILNSRIPTRFDRFAERVLQREGKPVNQQTKGELRTALKVFLDSAPIMEGVKAVLKGTYPTEEGFGRMDALGRGANGQFEQLDQRNILVGNAPATIPPLWYTHDYDWVQTVAAIRQPMGRNVTESWGVNSIVDLANPDPHKRFAMSVTMKDIFWMETLVSVLEPPKWPEEILGEIDRAAVERGRKLYHEEVFQNALDPAEEQWCPTEKDVYPPGWKLQPCPNPAQLKAEGRKGLCARCHAPVLEAYPDQEGFKYWQLPIYKLDVIGTDPGVAKNFASRRVYTGVLSKDFGAPQVGIAQALGFSTSAAMERQYRELGVPPSFQPTMSGFRSNSFRGPSGYPARPLDGYWTAAPYLHNNSVANLYQVLSPLSERDKSFWVGDPEFDPVHVGYVPDEFAGGFELKGRKSFFTAVSDYAKGVFRGNGQFTFEIAGNSNSGHEFRDAPKGTPGVIGRTLTSRERLDIIEYMKVMRTVPVLSPQDVERRKKLLRDLAPQYEGTGSGYKTGDGAENQTNPEAPASESTVPPPYRSYGGGRPQ